MSEEVQEMDPCELLAGSKGEVHVGGVKGCVLVHSSVLIKERGLRRGGRINQQNEGEKRGVHIFIKMNKC